MKVLIAVAALLVVGGVALVLILSSSDPDKTPGKPTQPVQKVAITRPPTEATNGQGGAPTVAPALPSEHQAGSDEVVEYMVGDVKIRDHRGSGAKKIDIPPNPHPANAKELPLEVSHDITSQVNKAIYACAAQTVPKEARGDKPKVAGQLVVTVKNHQLTVNDLTLETRDITDEAAGNALKQCAQEKAAALTANARDSDDIAGYKIQLNYAIP